MHQRLAVLLGSLAFFVAIVDMLVRVAISHSGTLARVLATIEDSGEMVAA